jgi:glucarate dehydratase
MGSIKITDVRITPVAFHDPPLRNAVGLHQPFALRAVLEVTIDAGPTGLGETYGDIGHLDRRRRTGRCQICSVARSAARVPRW